MFACLFALSALLSDSCMPAGPSRSTEPIHIYLNNTGGAPDSVLGQMKLQLGGLMRQAGLEVEWHDLHAPAAMSNGDLVVVEVRGSCAVPAHSHRDRGEVQLGSSAVADGRVLPFSWIDCDKLAQVLEPCLEGAEKPQREQLYGRSMARVLAHELYHVLANTLTHTREGLTKGHFDANDLLREQAEFSTLALTNLRLSRRPGDFAPRISISNPLNQENLFDPPVNSR